MPAQARASLRDVALVFLKIGFIGFGGPAAHLALMREEVVVRRAWLSDGQFLDLVGATNLIPGPNSAEMAIHVGFVKAGWRGFLLAGCCFVAPAMLIVLGLAWAYVRYGSTPEAEWLLYGIKPVIVVIVLRALLGLAPAAFKSPALIAVGVSVLALYLLGVNEIALLFGGGFVALAVTNARRLPRISGLAASVLPFLGLAPPLLGSAAAVTSTSLLTLFLTFLKIGSVLYGSGYVLLAFLRNDFVTRLGWLTDQQLLDAIAVGQITPGPLFTSATFIGYLVEGVPGALLATLAIFLPSFFFVAAINPLVPRLRASALMSGLLDGVNVAALGLMAGVLWTLSRDAIVDWEAALLAVAAAVLALAFRIGPGWLIVGGGLLGLLYRFLVQ